MSIWLVMRTADGVERPFPLEKPRTVIGRNSRCDVRIALSSVDDRHCELIQDGQNLKLKDLGSSTGTFHNGIRVEQAVVAPRDTLTVGPVTFEVREHRGASVEAEPKMNAQATKAVPGTPGTDGQLSTLQPPT